MLQENKLLEAELLAFYKRKEFLFILLEQPKHATGGGQPAPAVLRTAAGSTEHTSADVVSAEDPPISAVKHQLWICPILVHGGADLHLQPVEGTPRQSRWMPEGGSCQDLRTNGERSPRRSRFAGRTCDPMGEPRCSSLFLKDCTLWDGPMLGQFMKSCSLWEALTLEKFMENCVS